MSNVKHSGYGANKINIVIVIHENVHQVGSILFQINFIITQLAMFSGHCSLDGVASRLSHT